MKTKFQQVYYTNLHYTVEDIYQKRNMVILSIKNCCSEYKSRRNKHSTKFILRYNRLWKIIKAFPDIYWNFLT